MAYLGQLRVGGEAAGDQRGTHRLARRAGRAARADAPCERVPRVGSGLGLGFGVRVGLGFGFGVEARLGLGCCAYSSARASVISRSMSRVASGWSSALSAASCAWLGVGVGVDAGVGIRGRG